MVGMVPAMFQVPMSPPTASRMKIAPTAEVTPPTAATATATAATVNRFLKAMRLANAALRNSATCSGPLVASAPNRAIVVLTSPMRTTIGRTASSMVGPRGSSVVRWSAIASPPARSGAQPEAATSSVAVRPGAGTR